MSLGLTKERIRRATGAAILLLGFVSTAYFFAGNERGKAIVSVLSTIVFAVLAIGLRLLKRFKERVLEKIEERLDQSAEELGDRVYSYCERLVLKVWWRITSDFHGDYYEELVYKYRVYQTQGLKIQGPFKIDLQKIFVPLRVAPESPDRISAAMIQGRENVGNLEIWDFLARIEGQPAYRRIAVIGVPGSGKSTLLQQLTLTYAQHEQRRAHHNAPKLIPILLYLRSIQNEITSENPPSLTELINRQELMNILEPPPNWFEDRLRQNKCLVMLDGLDEVADEQRRIKVSQWVNKQMEIYPDNPFIVTSRPYGYRSAPIEQLRLILEIQPFNLSQVEAFIYNWYLQHEAMRQMRKEDWGVWEEARMQSDDLIERIKSSHALADMALNPLLLTMIATVHDNSGKLPERRVDLYREICEVLLARREAAKDKKPLDLLTSTHKQAVLQVLALELMRRNSRTFDLATASSIIKNILLSVKGEGTDSQAFLKQTENVSGLIVERQLGLYEFAHMSFQEYLAAAQIKDTNQESILIDNVNNEWWAETIRLYAAQTDATTLVRTAISSATVAALTLAYDCLEEGARVLPEVRKELGDSLEAGLESQDGNIRRLAAEVKLSRRVNRLLRISEDLEIDTSIVSCAEYQLFIDEKLRIRQYNQPDHWRTHSFVAGTASNAITGLRSIDAEEFCRWLTQKYPQSGSEFRLPELSEIEDHPVIGEQLGIGYWCKEGVRESVEGVAVEQLQLWREPIVQVLAHTVAHSISFSDGREQVLQLAQTLANGLNLSKLRGSANELTKIQPRKLPYDIEDTIAVVKRHLVRALAITHNLANSSIARDFAIAPDIALDIGIDIDQVRDLMDFDLNFNLDSFRGVNGEFDYAINLTNVLINRLHLAHSFAIEIGNDLVGATDLSDNLRYDVSSAFSSCLDRVLDRSLEAERDLAGKRTRSYLLLSCILWNSLLRHDQPRLPDQEHRTKSESAVSTINRIYAAKRDNALSNYMLLVLMSMRRDGVMPAWEGIRISRQKLSKRRKHA